jgi:uncharacterized membrane protein YphA (DoxX/SURF4 family)
MANSAGHHTSLINRLEIHFNKNNMNKYQTVGRIFFGAGIAGLGIMHFFYPGIRPIILPELTDMPAGFAFIGYATGIVLTASGVLIAIGWKLNAVSLVMGVVFLGLFVFGHLPWSLTAGSPNKYWVDTNKMIALSGGFLVMATISASAYENRLMQWAAKLAPLGKYLFAIMLYNFAVGHYANLANVSTLVPTYIPFPKFWTYLGGVALMGSAISIFSGFKVRTIMLLLSLNLFIWLLMLHLYYTVLHPEWNEGGNFVGALTCLCFCGTALVVSQDGQYVNKLKPNERSYMTEQSSGVSVV